MAEAVIVGERGDVSLHSRAIERILAQTSMQIPQTVRHSGSVIDRGDKYPSVNIDLRGQSVWVQLDVAVTWPAPLEQVAAEVRDRVLAEGTRLSGLSVERVDVTVHVVESTKNPRRRVQ